MTLNTYSKNNHTIFTKNFGKKDFIIQLFVKLSKLLTLINKKNNKKFKILGQVVGFTDDAVTETINQEGLYEKRELMTLISWLNPFLPIFKKSTFIDVGANIGNHTLFFSNYFKKIIAIEPHKKIFNVLKLNTDEKANIKVFNYAISDENKFSYLNNKKNNLSGSNLLNKPQKFSQKVICKKIDSLIKKSEKVNLIKIDVEGHEYQVIKGSINVIKKNNPFILFEHHPDNFISKYSPSIKLLKKLGYKNFAVISSNPRVSYYDGFLSKLIKKLINLFLNNMSFSIYIQKNIKPDYYPFIIAIPDRYNI